MLVVNVEEIHKKVFTEKEGIRITFSKITVLEANISEDIRLENGTLVSDVSSYRFAVTGVHDSEPVILVRPTVGGEDVFQVVASRVMVYDLPKRMNLKELNAWFRENKHWLLAVREVQA